MAEVFRDESLRKLALRYLEVNMQKLRYMCCI